jgi:hypothetical protein
METIIGVVDVVEPKISPQTNKMWLLKLSFKTDQGTIWLGAKPGQDTALAGFMSRVIDERDRPTEGRTRWQLETESVTETAKNGNSYDNVYVRSAKTADNQAVAGPPQAPTAPAAAGAAPVASDRDRAIGRAVAFKGAIDLVANDAKGPKGMAAVPLVAELTSVLETILDRSWTPSDETESSDDEPFDAELRI